MGKENVATIVDINGVILLPKEKIGAQMVNLSLNHDPTMLDRLYNSLTKTPEKTDDDSKKMHLITKELIEICSGAEAVNG